jgi:hypothetical protein
LTINSKKDSEDKLKIYLQEYQTQIENEEKIKLKINHKWYQFWK